MSGVSPQRSALQGKKPARPARTRRVGIFFIAFAFFSGWIFFVLAMDRVAMPLYIKSGREIVAPALIDKTLDEASAITRAYRLDVVVDGRDFSSSVPVDAVAEQVPAAGTILKPGRRIHIILSRGPRPLAIPNVVGKSPREAELIINSAGLEVIDKRWKASDKFPRGIVSEQYPPGDREVPETTGVILFVANGRHETNTVMPNLVDLSYQAALDTLKSYKFNIDKVTVQREEAPQLLPDTVIDQHPDPGVPTNTSIEIDLVVSTAQ
jgi:eukaryotic-like serine/threonine-protein kinase